MEKGFPSSSGQHTPPPRDYEDALAPEETKGLLSESDTHFADAHHSEDVFAKQPKRSWKRSLGLGTLLALVLLGVYSGAVVYRRSQALAREGERSIEDNDRRGSSREGKTACQVRVGYACRKYYAVCSGWLTTFR